MGQCLEAGVHWAELNGNGDRHLCSISMSKMPQRMRMLKNLIALGKCILPRQEGKKMTKEKCQRERNRTHPGSVEAELKV